MADKNKKEILKESLDKVKLVDAGVKNKYGSDSPVKSSSTDSENQVYYPHLYLDTKEAPMLHGSECGDEVTLLVKTCIESHTLNENSDRKNESFSLKITEIGVVSTTPEDDKEEY